MRNLIFGIIGVVWGGLVIVSSVLRGNASGDSAYATGSRAGTIFGIALFIAGIYAIVKWAKNRKKKPSDSEKP